MKTSSKGVELIKKYEGCKLNAYRCPANVPTIGYGNTYYEDGSKVKMGDKITIERANQLLLNLLPKYEQTVVTHLKVELTQNQFDALVCFCWNCGFSDTLFKMINEKQSPQVIYNWWIAHYITGGCGILKGLIDRRKDEATLFIS